MRLHVGHSLCLCLVGLMLFAGGETSWVAVALQATPAPSSTDMTCDVVPRSTAEVLTLAEAESGETASIEPLPSGDPADPATTAAIRAVLREMAACLTAGDMPRFYALHSDEWLRRSLGVVEGMAIQTISIPTLDDGNRAHYLGPWHVKILADGRVLAAVLLVVSDDLRPDPVGTTVLLFVRHDGQLLVDETIARVRVPDCALPVEVAAVVGSPPGTFFDSWSPTCV